MITYRIFWNDGAGGPVDYSVPVATVAGPPWSGPPLAPGTRTRFGVRAFDTVTGLDDGGRAAEAEVDLSAQGVDVTGTPSRAFSATARPGPTGTILASWAHAPGGRPIPAGFRVWATPGVSVDFTSAPAITLAFSPAGYGGRAGWFSVTLPGLTPGAGYAVGIRAYNGSGDDGGSVQATATATASPPGPVGGLSASATSIPGMSGRAVGI